MALTDRTFPTFSDSSSVPCLNQVTDEPSPFAHGHQTSELGIFADARTPCALFAIGLGLSIDGLRANIRRASLLSVVKLVIMPLIVYGLSVSLKLDSLYTVAAVVCAAVPTAKTAYILAGEYRCEEIMVAFTVSMTTLASVISLVSWL